MATSVNICNLALSHLGNRSRVSSIDPPDQSVEADLCAQFFSQARDETLELHDWSFARNRVALSLVANLNDAWLYAYALPSDCLLPRRIPVGVRGSNDEDSQSFLIEGQTLYTNAAAATLVYTKFFTDVAKFPPGFVSAFSYMLAAYLAGPIVKGADGAAASNDLRAAAQVVVRKAATANANQDHLATQPYPSGLAARHGIPGTPLAAGEPYPFGSGYDIV